MNTVFRTYTSMAAATDSSRLPHRCSGEIEPPDRDSEIRELPERGQEEDRKPRSPHRDQYGPESGASHDTHLDVIAFSASDTPPLVIQSLDAGY
jgi:hypothetical protein